MAILRVNTLWDKSKVPPFRQYLNYRLVVGAIFAYAAKLKGAKNGDGANS